MDEVNKIIAIFPEQFEVELGKSVLNVQGERQAARDMDTFRIMDLLRTSLLNSFNQVRNISITRPAGFIRRSPKKPKQTEKYPDESSGTLGF